MYIAVVLDYFCNSYRYTVVIRALKDICNKFVIRITEDMILKIQFIIL